MTKYFTAEAITLKDGTTINDCRVAFNDKMILVNSDSDSESEAIDIYMLDELKVIKGAVPMKQSQSQIVRYF